MNARQLYVYFRVAREHESAAIAAVRAMHAQWHGTLDSELLRSADDTGAHVTLMEVYRQREGIDAATLARIEHEATQRLAPWLVGERHVEVFEPCA